MLFVEKKPLNATASKLIAVPRDALFLMIGDGFLENYRKWSPEVKDLQLLTPLPMQVGSIFRQVRVDRGHKSDSQFVVSQFEPPARLSFREMGDRYRCSYELESPDDDSNQTLVTFTFVFPDLEPYMRPFEKLVRIAIQEGASKTVENLKRFSESIHPH